MGQEEQRIGAVEYYLDNCADIKVDIEALARLIEPEDDGVLSQVHPEVLDEKKQQYFQALRHARRTISWQAEGVGWNAKKKR